MKIYSFVREYRSVSLDSKNELLIVIDQFK